MSSRTRFGPHRRAAIAALIVTALSGLITPPSHAQPCEPEIIGSIGGAPWEVDVVGSLAYVSAEYGGEMLIFDVSDSASPSLLSRTDLPADAWGLDVAGEHVYIAVSEAGLGVLDVSDPTAPEIITFALAAGAASDVVVIDQVAYVACSSAGVHLFDVSDPSAPSLIQVIDEVRAFRFDLDGTLLFSSDNPDGVSVVDVSEPTSPDVRGHFDVAATGIGAGDGVLGVGTSGVFRTYDASDPLPLPELGATAVSSFIHDLVISASWAYIVRHDGLLSIIDISDPSTPTPISDVQLPATAGGIDVHDGIAYIACTLGGLQIVDISDPTAPAVIGAAGTPGYGLGVAFQADLVSVVDFVSGLHLIDVSDPAHPNLISRTSVPKSSRLPLLLGNIAYIIYDGDQVHMLDITDPAAPTPVGDFALPTDSSAPTLNGSYLYTRSPEGLFVIDVSLPIHPTTVAQLPGVPPYGDMTIVDDVAYIAAHDGELWLIDLSNPLQPDVIGVTPVSAAARIAVTDGYAFLAVGTSGTVVDVHDLENPTQIGTFELAHESHRLAIAGALLCSITHSGGLEVTDLSNPVAPVSSGFTATPGWTNSFVIDGTRAYLTEWGSGLQIIDISSCQPTPCAADLTGDQQVNVFDLLALLNDWGACGDPENCPADLDDDDHVNVFDLLDLLAQWGACG